MKRKIVSALLVMSMTASLVACGNSGSGSSDPADESVSVSSSASSESDASASASSESEAEAEESEMPEGYDETSTELYNRGTGRFQRCTCYMQGSRNGERDMPDGSCRGKTDGVCHDVPAHLKRWYVRDVQNGSAHQGLYTLGKR